VVVPSGMGSITSQSDPVHKSHSFYPGTKPDYRSPFVRVRAGAHAAGGRPGERLRLGGRHVPGLFGPVGARRRPPSPGAHPDSAASSALPGA